MAQLEEKDFDLPDLEDEALAIADREWELAAEEEPVVGSDSKIDHKCFKRGSGSNPWRKMSVPKFDGKYCDLPGTEKTTLYNEVRCRTLEGNLDDVYELWDLKFAPMCIGVYTLREIPKAISRNTSLPTDCDTLSFRRLDGVTDVCLVYNGDEKPVGTNVFGYYTVFYELEQAMAALNASTHAESYILHNSLGKEQQCIPMAGT